MARQERKRPDVYTRQGTFAHAGKEFKVYSDQWTDGRAHLYFCRKEDPDSNLMAVGVPRVSFHFFPQENAVVLSGIFVPLRYAGARMGEALITYFQDYVRQRGLKFEVTSHINKPTIARTLIRSGFKPVSENIKVEILPKSIDDQSRVPRVQVIQNAQNARLITHSPSKSNEFYKVTSPASAKYFPISSPDSVVAIQTRYVPPQGNNSSGR